MIVIMLMIVHDHDVVDEYVLDRDDDDDDDDENVGVCVHVLVCAVPLAGALVVLLEKEKAVGGNSAKVCVCTCVWVCALHTREVGGASVLTSTDCTHVQRGTGVYVDLVWPWDYGGCLRRTSVIRTAH